MATKPYFIGIAGPSCGGKTTISHTLQEVLTPEQAVLFPMDNYYLKLSDLIAMTRQQNFLLGLKDPNQPVGIAEINFDMPDALDTPLIFEHIATLAKGEPINCPVYLFDKHSRADFTEVLEPKPFIIVEGLFTLYWQLTRELCRTKVFVDCREQTLLERRLYRDVHERGRTVAAIHDQYRLTVKPMYEKYGKRTRNKANVIVDGEDNLDHSVQAILDHMSKVLKTPGLRLLMVDRTSTDHQHGRR